MAARECIFCKIQVGDLPATIVDEDERTVSFMDIAPATRGHALVIPRADAEGVNLLNSCGAAAWQTVFHFHVHVIPRYVDDPLRLPWVPSQGDPTEIAAAAQELSAN